MTQQRLSRNFEVVARVRPVSEEHETAVSAVDEHHVTVAVVPRNRKALVPKQGSRNQGVQETQSYEFNSVLGGDATQADVCQALDIDSKENSTGDSLDEGTPARSACGQEAESIAEHDEGVMFTALRKGFVRAQQQTQREFAMSTSVVEIYNERVVDLLNNRKELPVRHRRCRGFYLQGMKRVVCTDAAAATEVLKRALAYRRSRAHQMNESSSRSHAIITFHFDSWAAEGSAEAGEAAKAEQLFSLLKRARRAHANATDASRASSCNGSEAEPPIVVPSGAPKRAKRRMRKYGQLVFVDLAGSERLKATGSHQGDGMNESCAINRSLFALGRVLHALSEKSKGRQQPVPVRDSALTKILAHGLECAAHTTMIACLNPMASQLGQSTSTLHFAKLALSIKTSPVARLDPRDKIVMDLKQKISSLRKENQSLTKAFIWLCSGTADWDTLIQQLPQHVSQQLPASAPPLLTPAPSQSSLFPDQSPSSSGRWSGLPTRPCTPAVPRPKTSQATPLTADLPAAATFSTPPRTAPGSRASSAMPISTSHPGNVWRGPPSSPVQEKLLQFPALAALESEFQALVSRPATAAHEELVSIDPCSGVVKNASQTEPAAAKDSISCPAIAKAMPGHDLTPAAVRNALQGHLTGQGTTTVKGAPSGDGDGSAGTLCTGDTVSDCDAGTAPDMEANALLWALKNLWFGVEEDMTSHAYMVHSQLEAKGVKAASTGYYEQLSAEVQAAYPEKWKKYSSRGGMLNTMSKQQGIINSAVTVECALANRAAWAESQLSSNTYSNVHEKPEARASWPRISSGRIALVDELAGNTHTSMRQGAGVASAYLGKAVPRSSDVQAKSTDKLPSHGSALQSYMKPIRARSDSPYRPCITPPCPTDRPFSAGRNQTPGEQMRERILSSLELGNAADVVEDPNMPLMKGSAGSLPARSQGSAHADRLDMGSHYAACTGGPRRSRSVSRPAIPQKKGWNDCPNLDVPRRQGRLCVK